VQRSVEIEFMAIGDGIEAAAHEWAAAKQALQREPGAAARSVDGDGLFGVVRAGWIEFAIAAEEWREKSAIEMNGEN
jgi:hypothetical protein